MSMPNCGTFSYVFEAPKNPTERWKGQHLGEIKLTGNEHGDNRLVGLTPWLQIADGGMTPNPNPTRPNVLRSRLVLTASSRSRAQVAAFAFHIDSALIFRIQPGDELCLARTHCAGLGLSILRQKELVAAAGAVTAVPLGNNIRACFPFELIQKAESLFHEMDPEFKFAEYPIEISIQGKARVLWRGGATVGAYEVRVEHGFFRGLPGKDACAAIFMQGACSRSAVNLSAQLLDLREVEITDW